MMIALMFHVFFFNPTHAGKYFCYFIKNYNLRKVNVGHSKVKFDLI